MSPLGRFAAGLVLKGLLKKATGRTEPIGPIAPLPAAHAGGRRPPARGSRANAGLPRGVAFPVMMGSIALALPLMLIFEHPITRIVGVAGLFAFIVAGVFAIADPGFLESEEDPR